MNQYTLGQYDILQRHLLLLHAELNNLSCNEKILNLYENVITTDIIQDIIQTKMYLEA